MKDLPHDFDLHFDIKTEEKLIEEYKNLKQRVKLMEELCKHYKIELPKEI